MKTKDNNSKDQQHTAGKLVMDMPESMQPMVDACLTRFLMEFGMLLDLYHMETGKRSPDDPRKGEEGVQDIALATAETQWRGPVDNLLFQIFNTQNHGQVRVRETNVKTCTYHM